MGLFDRFRSSQSSNAEFNIQEATSGVLLSVVASDGQVSDDESDYFRLVANRHPIFRDQSAADFNRMIDKMMGILHRQGWRPLIDKCGADIPQDFKPTVFALAVDFVFADGAVEDEEKELVAYLQKALGISDKFADSIVQVLAVKSGV